MPKGKGYKKFDGNFDAAKSKAHSVLKPSERTLPKNRASLGTKVIKGLVSMLPNAGK